MQIQECLESAKEVVKYFRNKTLVHAELDKARKHVKVSGMVLLIASCMSFLPIQAGRRACENCGGVAARLWLC